MNVKWNNEAENSTKRHKSLGSFGCNVDHAYFDPGKVKNWRGVRYYREMQVDDANENHDNAILIISASAAPLPKTTKTRKPTMTTTLTSMKIITIAT